MHQKPLFEGQRLERYMLRINRLLGTEEKTYSPWKVGPPKRIKTEGPMSQRLDTFINYEQSFIVMNRIMELKFQSMMAFAVEKLKATRVRVQKTKKKEVPILKIPVNQGKNNILILRLNNIFKEIIKQSFSRIKQNSRKSISKKINSLGIEDLKVQKKEIKQIKINKVKVFMRSIEHLIKNRYYACFNSITNCNNVQLEVVKATKQFVVEKYSHESLIKIKSIFESYHSFQTKSINTVLYSFFKCNINISKSLKKPQNQINKQILPFKLNFLHKFKFLYLKNNAFSKIIRYSNIIKREQQLTKTIKIKKKLYFGNQIHSLSKLTKVLTDNLNSINKQFFKRIYSNNQHLKKIQSNLQKIKVFMMKNTVKYLYSNLKTIKNLKHIESGTKIVSLIFASVKHKYNIVLFKYLQLQKSSKSVGLQIKIKKNDISLLFSTLEAIYFKRLAISIFQLLNYNSPQHTNQSSSTFIYDEVLQFLDRQNHLSIQLNRYCSTLYKMIGANSTLRLQDSIANMRRVQGFSRKAF